MTGTALTRGRVAIRLTRGVARGLINRRRGSVAVSGIRGIIYSCFGVAHSALLSGDHGHRVIRTHRVTVCVSQALVGYSLTAVNTRVKNGSRTAILRTYAAIASLVSASGTFGRCIASVRGLLIPIEHWGELGLRGLRSLSFFVCFYGLFSGVVSDGGCVSRAGSELRGNSRFVAVAFEGLS